MGVTFLDEPKAAASGVTFIGDNQPVYRRETGKVVSAPSGMSGREINYQDDTQNQSLKKENFLGFSGVGRPVSFAQGYMKGILQTGTAFATSDLASKEKALRDIGAASQKDFSVADVFKQFLPTRAGRFAEIRTSQALGRGKLSFEEEETKLRNRINEIKKIDKDLPIVLKGMGLDPEDRSFFGQVGQGGSSLAMTIGTTMVTKNVGLASMIMAGQTNSEAYKQAREAGLPIDTAANAALIESGGVALIEAVGTNALFKVFGESGIMKKAVKGFLVQGTEEGAQEVLSILTKNEFDVTDTNIIDGAAQVLNSFIVGGFIGAPVAASIKTNADQLTQLSKRTGIAEKDLVRMHEISEEVAEKNPSIRAAAKQTIDQVFEEELSPATDDAQARSQVAAMANDFLEGRDVDFSNLPENDQKVLDELFNIRETQIEAARVEQEAAVKADTTLLEGLQSQIETARAAIKAPTGKKKPFIDFLKKQGGVRIGSPLDKELRAAGITPKTAPALFKKEGLVGDVDNFVASEFEEATGLTVEKEGDFIERQFLLDKLENEIRGIQQPQDQDIKAAEGFAEELDRLGLDIDTVTPDEFFEATEGRVPVAEEVVAEDLGEPFPLRPSEVVTKDVLEEVEQVDADNQGLMSGQFLDPVKNFFVDFGTGIERALTPISTRVKNISVPLFFRLRKFEFNVKTNVIKDHDAVLPFLKAIRRLDRDTQIALDLAMKNSDEAVITQIAEDNEIVSEITAVREVLDNLFDRAKAVDMDVQYRWDFFPRKVTDLDGLMDHFMGSEHWTIIQEAIKRTEESTGKTLGDAGRIGVINRLVRGQSVEGVSLSQKGIHKERTIRKVTAEINKFYATSDQALLSYINIANEAIETSRLFGQGQDIDGADNIEESVGKFINDQIVSDGISSRDARILKEILTARFNEKRLGYITAAIRDLSYIDTMGSFTSAFTQIGDLALSLYNSGLANVTTTIGGAIINRAPIKLKDIGIDKIGVEFSDGKLTSKGVDKVFTLTGLQKIDQVGKLTLVNSAFKKFQQRAKKGDAELAEQLGFMYGANAEQVSQDLQDGKITDDTKFLVFNTLLDMQPMAQSEMPEYYLRSGNLKILYMLKTFTIRQLDIYRREIFSQLNTATKTGDAKLAAKAIGNFVRLAGFWIAMGASVDYMKDLLRSFFGGDETEEPEDYVVDNMLKAFGFSKYQLSMVGKKGATEVFFDIVQPPAKFATNIEKDFKKAKKGELTAETSKSVRSIPLAGELYYFWFGAGQGGSSQKKKRKKGKRKSSLSGG